MSLPHFNIDSNTEKAETLRKCGEDGIEKLFNSVKSEPSNFVNNGESLIKRELNELHVVVPSSVAMSDDESSQKTPRYDEKCATCHRFHHELDIEDGEDQKRSKTSKNKNNDFRWIQCDHCSSWYHMLCSTLEPYEYYLYATFHCKNCVSEAGPSVEYKVVAPHRYRWYLKEEATIPEIEVGSQKWIEKFLEQEHNIPAPSDDQLEVVENGNDLNDIFEKYLTSDEWSHVFLIKNFDGLGMKMPDKDSFDIENVAELMGDDYEVDTIDVFNQNTYSMKLSTFIKKYRDSAPRNRLYNILSLEFSKNDEMSELICPPTIVKKMSMVRKLWPDEGTKEFVKMMENGDNIADEFKPRVEEFCLVGMANSYTDFHIDFGGSSVYYHVLKGEKVFYIAPPTDANLSAFEKHEAFKKTHEWFGHKIPGQVKRAVIKEGQTLLIPAGWIHAVWTPKDSLVFGGNFVHLGNAEMQMRVYQLENVVRNIIQSDEKFYFPYYEFLHWSYVRIVLIGKIRENNDEGVIMENSDRLTWNAAKCFSTEMRRWYEREKSKIGHPDSKLPAEELERHFKLLSKLDSEIRKQERLQISQTPGKKSKRAMMTGSGDDEYSPSTSFKRSKPARKINEKKKEVEEGDGDCGGLIAKINGIPVKEYHELNKKRTEMESADEKPPPLTLTIKLESNEDKKFATKMFESTKTSSGRKVKVNRNVMDYCGLNDEERKEDGEEDRDFKGFAEYDKQLEKCEDDGFPKKEKKKRIEKEVKPPKSPTKKASSASTAKQRLAKKLKL